MSKKKDKTLNPNPKPKIKPKPKKKAQTLTDGFFKKVMAEIEIAKEFLACYLPEDFKKILDLSTIKVEQETYIEPSLRKRASDVVYSVKTYDNEEAFVYVMIETQTRSDYWIAFRLMRYMMLLLERHQKNEDKLPLVAPIVVYSGSAKYNAPKNFWDLFAVPDRAKKIISGDYTLIDLEGMKDEEIKEKQGLGMLEFFLKHIHERDMLKVWEEFLTSFNKAILIDRENGYIYIKSFLWYTNSKVSEEKQQELEKMIFNNLSEEHGSDIMRTIEDKYRDKYESEGVNKGIVIGIEKGREEGREEVAKNLISENMPLENISRITGLDLSKLNSLKSELTSSKFRQ